MASEFSLISRYFVKSTPSAVLGPGDDCALLAPTPGCELAITTDMLVAGTHFFADTDPEDLGWKTLAVNLSDLAAMGARPRWALLAGALPDADEGWLAAFSRGLFACATTYGVELVGGDLTRGPLTLSVTALGEAPAGQAIRRDGATVGDDLWVSGQPGRAALGLRVLRDQLQLPADLADSARQALQRPTPRVELGLALRGLASAAIDVSDGLLGDLRHMLERSRVSAIVEAAHLPTLSADLEPALLRDCQFAGGDDYELLFAAAPAQRSRLAGLSSELGLPLNRIGRIVGGDSATLTVLDLLGQPIQFAQYGYDHFSS